jgi:hypothetical protein
MAAAPPPEPSLLDELSFAPHLQYRARYYHLEGKNFASGDARNFVRQRARAGASATYDDKVGLKIVLQDVRTWGEELDPVGDFSGDGFDVHEGYAFFRPAKGVDLRLGRQEVILLNARLIGNLDFAEQARSFDAARAMYDDGGLEAELLYALVRDFDENPGAAQVGTLPDGKLHLGMIHLGYAVTEWLVPHVLTIVEGDSGRDAVKLTAGALVDGKTGRGVMFDYTAEGYYQWGSQEALLVGGPEPRVSAFLFAARSRLSADYPIVPYLEVEVAVNSGDDDPGDATTKVFNSPHPTGHGFHGEAAIFINFPVDTAGRGLLDINAAIGTAGKPLIGRISYHYFDGIENRAAGAFGHELDFSAKWLFWDYASIAATYGFFVPGMFYESVTPDPIIEHVAFVTADLKFDG